MGLGLELTVARARASSECTRSSELSVSSTRLRRGGGRVRRARRVRKESAESAEGSEGVEGVVDAEGAPLRVAHPAEHGERVLLEELLIARWPEGVEQPSAPGVGAARARLDGPLVRLVGAVDDGRCGELAQLHLAAEVRDGDGMQQREAVADLLA